MATGHQVLRAIPAGEGVLYWQLERALHLVLDSGQVSWVSPFSPWTRPCNQSALRFVLWRAGPSWNFPTGHTHYKNIRFLQRCTSPMELNRPQNVVRKHLDVGPTRNLITPGHRLFLQGCTQPWPKVKAPVLEAQPPWLVKGTHKRITLWLFSEWGRGTGHKACGRA